MGITGKQALWLSLAARRCFQPRSWTTSSIGAERQKRIVEGARKAAAAAERSLCTTRRAKLQRFARTRGRVGRPGSGPTGSCGPRFSGSRGRGRVPPSARRSSPSGRRAECGSQIDAWPIRRVRETMLSHGVRRALNSAETGTRSNSRDCDETPVRALRQSPARARGCSSAFIVSSLVVYAPLSFPYKT